ncbi:MAG: hypothetical protein HQK49_15120 [Oligoflexia bacterium]|nr:hypothetical protein [Oligoflexia bacterium]
MLKIIFKNLEKSELAREISKERFQVVFDRFPDLSSSKVTITLSMENSPQQAGPDVFSVKFYSQGGRYQNVVLQKSAANLYGALGDLIEHVLDKLNRYADKKRVRERTKGKIVSIRQEMFA